MPCLWMMSLVAWLVARGCASKAAIGAESTRFSLHRAANKHLLFGLTRRRCRYVQNVL